MKYDDHVTIDQGWNHLQEYGINSLTGEADAYSLRILCDLSEKGVELIQSFLGDNIVLIHGSNWNSHIGESLAISCVMLPYSIFDDLRRFILFHVEEKTYVHELRSGQMVGTDENWADDEVQLDIKNTYTNHAKLRNTQHNEGGHNVHVATGRVA